MDKKEIKIGSRVAYRGSFGAGNRTEATIKSISYTKDGKNVDNVDWDNKAECCFELSNGKTCYGSQIDELLDEEIEVRITFKSEVYISGKDYDEINKKFQSLPIFSFEALDNDADFCDLIAAERVDDDSWDDVTEELAKC